MLNGFYVKATMTPAQRKEYEALQAKVAEQDRVIRTLLGETVEEQPEESEEDADG